MKHFFTLIRTFINNPRDLIRIFFGIVMIGVFIPQSLFAQVTAKNHFKTWLTQPLPFQAQVLVQDQFMQDVLQLIQIEFLSNPTLKVHEGNQFPIVNPNDHLTWYRAVGRDTLIKLKYENQFESATVDIGHVEYLLVPTQKEEHPPPVMLDHYKAYRIMDPKGFRTQVVMLQDQFDIFPENIDSLVPTYFLTPAVKNMEMPLFDSVTHYVAYQIFPNRFYPLEVMTSDQFGSHVLQVMNSWFLMVPTTKFLLGSIEGYKFHDYNGNGIREFGEKGLKDWYISLNGPVNKVTQTDVNGHYYFGDLPAGDYNITEDNQVGWNQTFPPHPGNHMVTLGIGEKLTDKDFGNCRDSIFITGYKYNDLDGDGQLDDEDIPLSGWTIELRDSSRHLTYSTVTNQNGYFEFTHLLPGLYVKKEILQEGWIATAPRDIDKGILLEILSDDTTEMEIILNFKKICITGVKFFDHNQNGRRDVGDEGLFGWNIRLSGVGSTLTDELGRYSFCDIGPGTYRICEDVQSGWIATCDTCYDITVQSGLDLTYDFCNYQRVQHDCPPWTNRFHKKKEGMGFKIPTDAKLMTRNLAIRDTGDIYICGYSDGYGTKYDYITINYDEYGVAVCTLRYNNSPVNKDDKAYALTVDDQKNVYVTGESDGGSSTKMDIATVKYNSAGVEQWVKRYNNPTGNKKDAGYAIAINKDGTIVYVAGETFSGKETGGIDFITIAYDAITGSQQWVQIHNGPTSKVDKAYAIAVDEAGDVIVTGESDSIKADYFTIKYSGTTGAFQWENYYNNSPTNKKDYAFAIKTDALNNVYVTGASEGAQTSFDYATVKYSAAGAQIWVARYDEIFKKDFGYDLALDANNDVYVTGASTAKDTKLDYATLKYDGLTGAPMWASENRYDGIRKNEIARSVTVCDAEKAVFVTGSSDQGAGRKLDYVTLKIDAVAGGTIWTGRYNGPGLKNDIAYNVAVRPVDCCVVLTGTSDGGKITKMDFATIQGPSSAAVPGPITSPGIYDGESEDEDEEAVPMVYNIKQNYPNPFNPITTIVFELPEEAFVSLSVYNILGQELVKVLDNELMDSGLQEAEFDASSLASGVYFYRFNAVGTGSDEEIPSQSFTKVMKMLLLK
ncbi:MAG: SdrD B-like domain-containing protein [Bacteroidota bacterium]|nr:SdrD B-like domain-containing protein [Bacteroidota bacterium]